MIKELHIRELYGDISTDMEFNDDINIITGINGSGKTSILKIIWLLISGNIDRVIMQMDFHSIKLITSEYFIEIIKNDINLVEINSDLIDSVLVPSFSGEPLSIFRSKDFDNFVSNIIAKIPQSIFFPTFRRVEGGFDSMRSFRDSSMNSRGERVFRRRMDENDELEEALSSYSNSLSNNGHLFVCSLSTNDIKELLSTKYAQISTNVNKNYQSFSSKIIDLIMDYESSKDESHTEAIKLLNILKHDAVQINKERDDMLKPFNVLSDLIDEIFNNKGIKITDYLSLGHRVEKMIDSSLLSSGEKQMLSFLCYNTFIRNSPIFIDEPELSLHVDWQRKLFNILLNQGTNNQYFVATHSQLIYTNYADKEIEVK
jgi:ABC-type lipoprotein export system ATPase subunit